MNLENLSCPLPALNDRFVVMGHGGGGRLSSELIDHIFVAAFKNRHLEALGDAAILSLPGQRIAFTTDSFVVRPLFFPGGCIGDLAVHGTINDLAMMGARPLYLTCAFILEEGLEIELLRRIASAMARAASEAGVAIVAGDTKVVDRGHGDGVFITTTGIGVLAEEMTLAPQQARPGDVLLVSGQLGTHGIAIMSVREGLQFETVIESDCASLHTLAADILAAAPGTRVMRDPTRGGLAASANEIARASQVGLELREQDLPVHPHVAAACEFLGLDPLYVANEGKLLAILPASQGEAALAAARAHPLGREARLIGQVVAEPAGMVTLKTRLGGTRVVDLALGEQLPRIC